MVVKVSVHYKGNLVANVDSLAVPLDFVAGSGLKYQGKLVDEVRSDVRGDEDPLVIDVTDGNSWRLNGEARYEVYPMTSGGMRWEYESNGHMKVTVWQPTQDDSGVEWNLLDLDDPTVKLKVVVKRVP